jgi:hypothetical protein
MDVRGRLYSDSFVFDPSSSLGVPFGQEMAISAGSMDFLGPRGWRWIGIRLDQVGLKLS